MDLGYFVLNKSKKFLKFYQFLILLSRDLDLGPSQNLRNNDKKFKAFHKRGLHFLNINVSFLLKINELRDVVGHTKPAILGVTESKLESSVSDQEVKINGYSILRSDRNRNRGSVACYVRADLCFNSRNVFSNLIENFLFQSTYSKSEPYFDWYF